MKKTYVIMGVFCCLLVSFSGCKKTSYFEAKEAETVTEETESLQEEEKEQTKEQEDATPPAIYVYIYPKDGYTYVVDDQPVNLEDYAGKMNINTATVSELMTLPGIGQSKAETIVAYREEHGIFQKPEDLMQIPGIKEGVYSKIADQIFAN